MERLLYLDGFSGISGDKMLGALVDLGVPVGAIGAALATLPVAGYRLSARPVERNWMRGTQVLVELDGSPQPHRGRKEILAILDGGGLAAPVRELAVRMFERILEAEALVHGIALDEVHLHEVGAVDAIVDIVGTAVAIHELGPDRILASPVNVGSGTVATAHGLLPVPAPATAEILKGVPVFAAGPEMEMTTPTGAVIVRTLASSFGPMPSMTVERIGLGAGSKDPPGFPNLLRAMLGPAGGGGDAGPCGELELETNVDDCPPSVLAHAMERMFAAGALDVFFQAVQMKKGRPGVLLTAVLPSARLAAVAEAVFRETTSIGLRYRPVSRITLDRRFEPVDTPWGRVTMKISSRGGTELQATPEYEEARGISLEAGVPLHRVLEEALAAWRRRGGAAT